MWSVQPLSNSHIISLALISFTSLLCAACAVAIHVPVLELPCSLVPVIDWRWKFPRPLLVFPLFPLPLLRPRLDPRQKLLLLPAWTPFWHSLAKYPTFPHLKHPSFFTEKALVCISPRLHLFFFSAISILLLTYATVWSSSFNASIISTM